MVIFRVREEKDQIMAGYHDHQGVDPDTTNYILQIMYKIKINFALAGLSGKLTSRELEGKR